MGLFGDGPELLLDPHTGMPADDNDYLQTTTITEVPTLSPGLAGTSSSAAAAAAAAAGVPVLQRMPISAGTTVFGPGGSSMSLGLSAAAVPPGVVVKESPTAALAAARSATAADHLAAAAAAGPSSSVEAVLDQQAPRVDSPSGQFDMGMQDLLANLNTVNSSELMLTDDAKDDLWDMLFGRTSSGGLTADPAAAAAGVGGSAPLGMPSSSPLGMGALDALDGATAMSIGSPNLMGLDPAVAAAPHRQA